jgi:hypothetical protein
MSKLLAEFIRLDCKTGSSFFSVTIATCAGNLIKSHLSKCSRLSGIVMWMNILKNWIHC